MGTNTREAACSEFVTKVHDKVHRGWAGSRGIRHFKGVVLAKRRLDKFYWFFWIVVYIRIEVQLNLHLCANYLGGKY